MIVTDMYRTTHQTEYTFFKGHMGHFFSRIDRVLSCKQVNKSTTTKIIVSSIFPDCSGVKLEISDRRKAEKSTNIWKLNNKQVKEEIKEKVLNIFELMIIETQRNKMYRM